MFTGSRFVQWPHRTVTVLNKLEQGTLTCNKSTKKKKKKKIISFSRVKNPNLAIDDLIYKYVPRFKNTEVAFAYSKNGVADIAVNIAELLRGLRREMFIRR